MIEGLKALDISGTEAFRGISGNFISMTNNVIPIAKTASLKRIILSSSNSFFNALFVSLIFFLKIFIASSFFHAVQ